MTLHTRVAVTSGDVTPEAVFAQCTAEWAAVPLTSADHARWEQVTA